VQLVTGRKTLGSGRNLDDLGLDLRNEGDGTVRVVGRNEVADFDEVYPRRGQNAQTSHIQDLAA
jgi:hypothetical protein